MHIDCIYMGKCGGTVANTTSVYMKDNNQTLKCIQLRGRSGRQGDPGSTRFFLSLEDNIFRIFGGDRIQVLALSTNFVC